MHIYLMHNACISKCICSVYFSQSHTCTHLFRHTHSSHAHKVALTKYHPHTLGQNVVQHSRLTTLTTACADHTHNSTHSNYWRGLSDYERQAVAQRIFVDDYRSLLFCHTPLSGVSAWMKVMYFTGSGSNLDDIGHVTNKDINNRKNFVYLTSYSLEEQEKETPRPISLSWWVQHPLLRAATTYRLKFLASNRFFQEKFGAEIREKYRTKDKQIGNVRFTEFVHYLVGFENQSRMNEHWKPLEQLCRPCEVNYDVILHHESMLQDSEEVLTAAHLTERVPELPRDYWDQVTVSYAHQLFGEVPSLLLGRLVTQYSNDFNMFSYSTLLPWKH